MSDPQSPQTKVIDDAFFIAAETVISTIECEAVAVQLTTHTETGLMHHRWWDTRPMLDEERHPPEFIDIHRRHLRHALAVRLAHPHATEPHLVRIVGR